MSHALGLVLGIGLGLLTFCAIIFIGIKGRRFK